MEQPVKPVVMIGRNKREVNTFLMKVSQHIPASVNGESMIAAFDSEVEFQTETAQEITAENFAAWAIENLDNWLHIQRLQGKQGLKLSKDVEITFAINGKEQKTFTKFTMNKERLVKKLHTMPELLVRVFRVATPMYKATIANAEKRILEINNTVLAPRKLKEPKLEEVKVEEPLQVEDAPIAE